MGMLSLIKRNSRLISERLAGTGAYFELATTNLSLYRAIRSAVAAYARGRLLDAGAGRGAYRSLLERHCERCESLDAVDCGGIDHVADLQNTGLPAAQYDTIVCTQVLQHLPEPQQAIAEIARMLRPGGRVIVTVPHLVWLHNEPHDYLRFTPHGLRHMVEEAGLHVVEEQKLGGLICFLAYAPSTFALALLWPVRPLFRLGLWCNRVFIRLVLWVDGALGAKALYPTNILMVAEKSRADEACC